MKKIKKIKISKAKGEARKYKLLEEKADKLEAKLEIQTGFLKKAVVILKNLFKRNK